MLITPRCNVYAQSSCENPIINRHYKNPPTLSIFFFRCPPCERSSPDMQRLLLHRVLCSIDYTPQSGVQQHPILYLLLVLLWHCVVRVDHRRRRASEKTSRALLVLIAMCLYPGSSLDTPECKQNTFVHHSLGIRQTSRGRTSSLACGGRCGRERGRHRLAEVRGGWRKGAAPASS